MLLKSKQNTKVLQISPDREDLWAPTAPHRQGIRCPSVSLLFPEFSFPLQAFAFLLFKLSGSSGQVPLLGWSRPWAKGEGELLGPQVTLSATGGGS